MYEAILRTKFQRTSDLLSDNIKQHLDLFTQEINEENLNELLLHIRPSGDMAFYFHLYLDMVDLLFNIMYFQRSGNWSGYLQAIAEFLPFCFSLNRQNYARNLSYHYVHMLNLPTSHSTLNRHLEDGGFTASISGFPHSQIPCDQIIEMTINRQSKDTGGLSGKTENVGVSMRWTRINHIMAALRGYLDEIIRRRTFTRHIDLGERRMLDDENDVVMLSSCLKEWVLGLWVPDETLANIATGKKADLSMVENVKSTKKRGEEAMSSF